ncbi:hypothetical protein IPJ72_04965 [Candidatus Peregrinibacteria bacterium]|nr:MAG: hypothetical protein IPJ72_04965 [Candidatus Peregrinibacteria bacterium]
MVNALRERGINTVSSAGKDSIKSQMRVADRMQARYSLIMGQIEVQENTIILRDMHRGSQEVVPYDTIVDMVAEKIGGDRLDSKNLWEE